MFVYFTFLVSGVLFIVNGALSGNLWSVAASSAFMLGVTLLIVKLERQREKDKRRVHYLILTGETRPDPSWLSAYSVQRPD
jgi:hypothetical protein